MLLLTIYGTSIRRTTRLNERCPHRRGREWISQNYSAVSVASTATDLVAADLANRKRILIQNASTKRVYIGNSSVTTSNGIELSPGSALELDAAAAVDLYGIVASGTADVRIMELA